jgi:hypothetical protein
VANSSQLLTGLRTLTADHMSSIAVDLTFTIMPTVAFLIGQPGDKDSPFGIGRPKGVVSGAASMKGLNKETVLNTATYRPIITKDYPSTSLNTVLGQHGTMPLQANADTDTTVSYFVRPHFRYTELATPLLVWKKDIELTKSSTRGENPDVRKAVGSLFKTEIAQKMKTQLSSWNSMFWSAASAPSDADNQDGWDSQYSFANALKEDNSYAGIDRAQSANSYWRGNYVTTNPTASAMSIVEYVRYDHNDGVFRYGNWPMLYVVGPRLWTQFRAECRTKGAGVVVSSDTIPNMGQFGHQKTDVIKIDDNNFFICDPSCPTNGVNGATANAVLALTPSTWTVAIRSSKNFAADDWFDLTQTEGGKDAFKTQIRTELMLACEAPKLNFYFTDVS